MKNDLVCKMAMTAVGFMVAVGVYAGSGSPVQEPEVAIARSVVSFAPSPGSTPAAAPSTSAASGDSMVTGGAKQGDSAAAASRESGGANHRSGTSDSQASGKQDER